MSYTRKLSGEKIYLSSMNIEDMNKYIRWMDNPEVAIGVGLYEESSHIDASKAYVEKCINDVDKNFAIVRISDDLLMGYIGLENSNRTASSTTVRFFIGDRENRGKGYGIESLRLVCHYAFEELHKRNIYLWATDYDELNISIYEKVGFTEAGRLQDCVCIEEKYYDKILMELDPESLR
ncbi:MAG: GNAT family N-acetyltransferase [Firmicutes bacterium]|nr:GNAT family N-acetyltransferase [[Eubacterium] siraeum]MCM1488524.1 GNAT family N-acetyltransferase [Bacillota bacterium]